MLDKTIVYGDPNLSPIVVGIAVECIQPIAWHLSQEEYDGTIRRVAYAIQAELNDRLRNQ